MRIAICDDEINTANALSQIVKAFMHKEQISNSVQIYTDGQRLVDNITNDNYDIIFLDIGMSGIDGLETAQKIRQLDKLTTIIYVTSFDEHRGSAFAVHAFGYIVKPFSEFEIEKIFCEAVEYRSEKHKPQMIYIDTFTGRHTFDISSIYYIEYNRRVVKIISTDGVYEIYMALKKVADIVSSYDFASPHQCFLVNLYHVQNIIKDEIIMINDDHIPLSQKKAADFKKVHNKFISRNFHTMRG